MLLHGDLHHFNILQDDADGWVAIDPKGVTGDPAFDAGPLMLNPYPAVLNWPDLRSVAARRVAIISEMLSIDKTHIVRCCQAFVVLATWWTLEERGRVGARQLAMIGALTDLI